MITELLPHLGRETPAVFNRRLHTAETSLARQSSPPALRPLPTLARCGEWTADPLPLPDGTPPLQPAQEQAVRIVLSAPVRC